MSLLEPNLIVYSTILLFFLLGLINGFFVELLNLLGIVFGVTFASYFYQDVGQWFSNNVISIESVSVYSLIGFSMILFFFIVSFILLGELLKKIRLSFLVRIILGGLFGGIKGFLILSIFFYLALKFDFAHNIQSQWISNSKLYVVMDKIASSIISSKLIRNAPKDSQEVKQEIQDLKDKVIESTQELGENIIDKTKQKIEEINQPSNPQPQTTTQEGQ